MFFMCFYMFGSLRPRCPLCAITFPLISHRFPIGSTCSSTFLSWTHHHHHLCSRGEATVLAAGTGLGIAVASQVGDFADGFYFRIFRSISNGVILCQDNSLSMLWLSFKWLIMVFFLGYHVGFSSTIWRTYWGFYGFSIHFCHDPWGTFMSLSVSIMSSMMLIILINCGIIIRLV